MLRLTRVSAVAFTSSVTSSSCSNSTNAENTTSTVNTPNNGGNSLQSVQVLRSLYRRLRKEGEERQMMERALSVRPLAANIKIGIRLLHHHTMLVNVDREAREVPFWRLFRRLRLAAARRYFAWRIFLTRLRLHSTAAISDALIYTLFIIVCVMLYQIYMVCRIGVTRAEERYRTLAIPILQTFDALEEAQERRRLQRKEMEEDVLRQR